MSDELENMTADEIGSLDDDTFQQMLEADRQEIEDAEAYGLEPTEIESDSEFARALSYRELEDAVQALNAVARNSEVSIEDRLAAADALAQVEAELSATPNPRFGDVGDEDLLIALEDSIVDAGPIHEKVMELEAKDRDISLMSERDRILHQRALRDAIANRDAVQAHEALLRREMGARETQATRYTALQQRATEQAERWVREQDTIRQRGIERQLRVLQERQAEIDRATGGHSADAATDAETLMLQAELLKAQAEALTPANARPGFDGLVNEFMSAPQGEEE